ncbi:facilitated trehalose transporter Tret1-like [Trichoplusia ni]|uniref:Facilitated trehalose transporter Tret1-like n=1 Tax=Trichoplusia ni TaxID=7111 RepID=A0A7E5VN52_TRINI|nr:facilitated trehalose transporter Tret1-like [Trichoplusia ni]
MINQSDSLLVFVYQPYLLLLTLFLLALRAYEKEFRFVSMDTRLKKQYWACGCLYLGQMVTGYGLGWTAPVLPKLGDINETPLDDVISEQQAALVASIFFIGSTIGPYVSAYLSNLKGRKPCLFASGVITLVGFIMLALSKSLAMIYSARVVSGLGGSVMFIINLVYIGEVASTNIRGILLTLTGFFSTLGMLVIYVVGPFVQYSVVNWIATALTVGYLLGVYFIPESPVFQVMTGKIKEASENLISLGREKEIDTVVAIANQEGTKSELAQFTEIFTIKSNRKTIFILLVLNILQQLSGFYAIILFVTAIFDMSGSNLESHISTIIVGVVQMVAALITPLFVENIGRKPLLTYSTAISTLCLGVLGTYFYLYDTSHPVADKLQWLSLTALIIYFLSFSVGLAIIPNAFAGEMFTSNVRSMGTSISLTVSWLVGFGVSTAFGYMIPAWGAAVTFWIYTGACALAVLFSVVYVPETKGKTLLEIQEMLSK